jgi:hypothetical protein
VQKFAGGTSESLFFLIFFHTLARATSRRSENSPLKILLGEFGMTAPARPKRRAQVGIWRVIPGATSENLDRFYSTQKVRAPEETGGKQEE